MKWLFYAGLAGGVLFGFLKYNAVMPVPIVDFESLDAGYFLHEHRWIFRSAFALLAAAGAAAAFRGRRKWLPSLALAAAAGALWFFNFQFSADALFEAPDELVFKPREQNAVAAGRVVVGVVHNGEAKAYPVRFLVFHHQVRDTIGGKPVIVTYCNTCRTARVYEPLVAGRETTFRLVGMSHLNSVYEDAATGSWWQQATGRAVAGPAKGAVLRELKSVHVTVEKWFALRPDGLVMQSDADSEDDYPSVARLERSAAEAARSSWGDDSWVVAVEVAGASKAYDWNGLKRSRVVNDRIAGRPIVVALSRDERSIAAFERPPGVDAFRLHDDLFVAGGTAYDFAGRGVGAPGRLELIEVSQEFWRCRRDFYPGTERWDAGPG